MGRVFFYPKRMQAVREYWREKITSWENWRYSLWSLFNPASYAIRERLKLAHREISSAIQTQPNTKILELGCGSGQLLSLFPPPLQFEYFGIDIAESAILRAKKLYPNSNIQFASADILPFLENNKKHFDLCLFLGVMDWLEDEENKRVFQLIPSKQMIFSYTEAGKLLSPSHPYERYRRWHRERQKNNHYQKMLEKFPLKHSRAQVEALLGDTWKITKEIDSQIPGNPSKILLATKTHPAAAGSQ